MFKTVERVTSFLITHKAKDAELEGAIDSFYCEQCCFVRVSHKTRCIGNYRITTIRTTYEHPSTRKFIRCKQASSDDVSSA